MSTGPRLLRRLLLIGSALGTLMLVAFVGLWAAGIRPTNTLYRFTGNSMSPCYSVDQVVLVDRSAAWRLGDRYLFGAPARGDFIVLREGGQGTWIKRVVGLPGELVALRDGQLVIDGNPVDEEYRRGSDGTIKSSSDRYAATAPVPDGMVFVIGDNRDASADSRLFGPRPVEDIVGRVITPCGRSGSDTNA